MPDETLHRSTTNRVLLKAGSGGVVEEKPFRRFLRQPLSWLVVAFILFNGALTALVLNLIVQHQQQARKLNSLAETQVSVARLQELENQITWLDRQVTSLNQQLPPDAASQFKATANQLKELQTRLNDAQVTADTLRQVNEILLRQVSSTNITRTNLPYRSGKSSRLSRHR